MLIRSVEGLLTLAAITFVKQEVPPTRIDKAYNKNFVSQFSLEVGSHRFPRDGGLQFAKAEAKKKVKRRIRMVRGVNI